MNTKSTIKLLKKELKYHNHTENFYKNCKAMGIPYEDPEKYISNEEVHNRLIVPYYSDLSFLILITFLIVNSNLWNSIGVYTLFILNILFLIMIFKYITPIVLYSINIKYTRDLLLGLPKLFVGNVLLYRLEIGTLHLEKGENYIGEHNFK